MKLNIKNEILENQVKKFKQENPNYKIIYITYTGSKLFGTSDENSDLDIKGIFIPDIRSMVLKKDIEHYTFKSNTVDNKKNSKDDIDIQFYSISKYLNMLKNGDVGAIDILFSMFREDTIIYYSKEIELIKRNYKKIIGDKFSAFNSYALTQAKKYGIKGTRFKEVKNLQEYLNKYINNKIYSKSDKIESVFEELKKIIKEENFEYIKFVKDLGPNKQEKIDYIEVLGKKFHGQITFEYFNNKIEEIIDRYGHRSEKAQNGIDNKALSHSLRIINECLELIETGKIVFPVKDAKRIYEVKKDTNMTLEKYNNILDELEEKITKTNNLLKQKEKKEYDNDFFEKIYLDFFKSKQNTNYNYML